MRLFIAALLLFAADLHAAVAPEHLVRLDEAYRLADTIGAAVWPGFRANEAPVVLIDGDFEYLLNSAAPAGGFHDVTGQTFRERPVFVRPRTFAPKLQASFPAIGRDAVVIGTAEATGLMPARWTTVVLHEFFHVYEGTRGQYDKVAALAIGPRNDGQWQLDFPFPYADERVRRALHLTGLDLYRAIESDADLAYDAHAASEALQNVVDVLALAFPTATKNASYMKFVATGEGVARYFEYRVAELAARAYKPSDTFAKQEGAGAFRDAWESYYRTLPYQIKHLGNVSRSRPEFYSLGLGLALVLDRIRPGWQGDDFIRSGWIDDTFRDAVSPAPASCPAPGKS